MFEKEVWEIRGVENLVYAEVLVDDETQYVTGDVKSLAPTQKIAKQTENSTDAHFYDNNPIIVLTSTGATTLGLTVAPPDLMTFAEITNQRAVVSKGAMIEGERNTKKFALGFKYNGTDGYSRVCWFLKGIFSIPNEEYNTADSSTNATNIVMEYKAISTTHKFIYDGKTAKSVTVDERLNNNIANFFNSVVTPDTLPLMGSSIAPVEFLPSGTTFTTSITVTLASASSGVSIYYTTDGSSPTASSTLYEEPFTITDTTTVKAFAKVGGAPTGSYMTSKTYVKLK